MPKLEDLTGQKFGRLTVIKRAEDSISPKGYHKVQWLCKCDCGNISVVRSQDLKEGNTKSCGCFHIDKITKHNLSKKGIYRSWKCMVKRRSDSKNKEYKNYGGRGISVCQEWLQLQNFYNWAMDNGYKEGLSIDRIDVNGNYCPENCRWATAKEQCRNRRNNIILRYDNKTHCLTEWAEILQINTSTMFNRFYRTKNEYGLNTEKLFATKDLRRGKDYANNNI